MSNIDKSMKSWKTTTTGIALLVAAVANAIVAWFDDDPSTNVDMAMLIITIIAGIQGLLAKDGDKSTEDVS